ncbi:MAG: hypothetical protein ACPLYX_11025 [Rectinema subterraneum]|uniref:hypothetical protein n=1 Tax=Rectinema subterraneum TaxID=2653714 RepID=UPI003C7D824C
MELRRLTSDICHFSDNAAECDFIVNAHREKPLCIQMNEMLGYDVQDIGQDFRMRWDGLDKDVFGGREDR